MLIKEALSILQSANTKIAELGVSVVEQYGDNSPEYPTTNEQLSQSVQLFDLLLKFIILNEDGDEIIGVRGDNDADINSLLIQLQEVAELNNLVLPSPIVTIVVTETGSGGAGFPAGASEGDLVYFHNGDWVRLAKGSDGQSLVATASTIQWQSQVGNGIPSGGSTNQFLKKNSNTSYDVAWAGIATTDITGVTSSATELNILDGATFSTTEANLLTGLTGGSLQSQLAAKLGTGLANGSFLVGNGGGVATAVAPTGDVTFNNAGVFAIGTGVIVNADVHASAGIARTKLASGNNYRLVINGAAGAMDEAAAITPARVIISDANGIPIHSGISATTLTYLDATSSIQTQIDSKLTVTLTTPAQGDIIYYTGSAWVNLTIGTNGQLLSSNGTIPTWVSDPPTGLPSGGTTSQYLRKVDNTDYNAEWHTFVTTDITDISATAAEINILSGVTVTAAKINFLTDVTANIQSQIDLKLSRTLTENYLFIGNASNVAIPLAPGADGYIFTSVGGVPSWVAPAAGGTVTSIDVSGGTTGLTFTGGPINTNGTITMAGVLAVVNGGTGSSTFTGWLLASGGAITGANTISGAFNIGFTNTAIGFGVAPGSITASTKFDLRGAGTTTGLTQRWADSANTLRASIKDNGQFWLESQADDVEGLVYGTAGSRRISLLINQTTGTTYIQGYGSGGSEWRLGTLAAGQFGFVVQNYNPGISIRNTTSDTTVTGVLSLNTGSVANSIAPANSTERTIISSSIVFTPASGGNADMSFIKYNGNWTFSSITHTTGIVRGVWIAPTINQTFGSGTFIGFDYSPTVTAVLGTHLAWRNTSGDVLIGGTTITAGSVLVDMQSTTKALLITRVTNLAAVATPVNGMIVLDASTGLFNFRQNGAWVLL